MISLANPLADRADDRLAHLGMTATIKASRQESNGALGLVELTLDPHFRNMVAHWHQQTLEVIYVLAGTVAVTVEDATFTAASGRVVIIPPRSVHHLWNPTDAPARLLLLYSPGGLEAYFAALATACTASQLSAIAAQYDQFAPPLLETKGDATR